MISDFLSRVYEKIVRIRNKKYDLEEKEIVKIKLPVISVGNLSAGGTGKTPFVQMLARELIELKIKPAIIGRGYKRKSKGEIIVSDGNKTLVSAQIGGDEMVLLAETLKVPVVAHDKKALAAITVEKRFDVDCLIVDDGFQHRALSRNLDIVLIDKDTLDNPHLLPKGYLREPLDSIKRADVICLTGSTMITDELKSKCKNTALFIKVKPYQGMPYRLGTHKEIDDQEIERIRKGLLAVAGIAKPQRFFDMLKDKGFHLKSNLSFSDHHNYDRNDIEKIYRFCQDYKIFNIGITEKDAAKLIEFKDRFEHYEINCYVFPINLKIIEGRKPLINLIKLTCSK